jgi:methanogenic corrinoid protein MtbC1
MPAHTAVLLDDYVAALLAGDGTRARHLIDVAVDDGVAVPDVCLHVLGPALEHVGELWERGEISVAHEHYAAQVSSGVLAALAPRMRRPPRGGRLAVIACTQGEQHAIGVQMVGEFLEGEAWEVLQLGAGLPAEDLQELVAAEQPDLVGLSTTTPAMLPAAERTLGLLGELDPRPVVVVGGRAWDGVADERVRAMGADVRLPGPVELVELVAERLPPLPEDDDV